MRESEKHEKQIRKFVFHSTSETLLGYQRKFVHDILDSPIGKAFIISRHIYLFEALLENASRFSIKTKKSLEEHRGERLCCFPEQSRQIGIVEKEKLRRIFTDH